MIQIPPADYSKEKGIRGLIQIARSIDHHKYSERVEIVTRYFTKFKERMKKAGTPLTPEEEKNIREHLLNIISDEKNLTQEEMDEISRFLDDNYDMLVGLS